MHLVRTLIPLTHSQHLGIKAIVRSTKEEMFMRRLECNLVKIRLLLPLLKGIPLYYDFNILFYRSSKRTGSVVIGSKNSDSFLEN